MSATLVEETSTSAPARAKKQCDRCERTYHYVPDDKKLCYRCYVAEYLPINFVFHRDLPPFARDVLEGEELSEQLCSNWKPHMPHVAVHVFSRRQSETIVWQEAWERSPSHPATEKGRKPWSYRGWCSYYQGKIVILVDDVGVETPESIAWIFWHELGHMGVSHVALVDDTFSREDCSAGIKGYDWEDDRKHEAHAEEQFVNRIATSIVGQDLNRLWWRERVNAYLNPTLVAFEGEDGG